MSVRSFSFLFFVYSLLNGQSISLHTHTQPDRYAKLLLARSPPPVANTQQELDQIEMPLIYTFFMKNNLHVEASEVLRSLAIESGFVSTQHQDHKYPSLNVLIISPDLENIFVWHPQVTRLEVMS